jgi:hypothetical protein
MYLSDIFVCPSSVVLLIHHCAIINLQKVLRELVFIVILTDDHRNFLGYPEPCSGSLCDSSHVSVPHVSKCTPSWGTQEALSVNKGFKGVLGDT